MKKTILKKAFIDTLPVMTGYLVLGFGFGIIMKSAGYGVLMAITMSFVIYAGSMQYAAVGLFTAGASFLTVALTTLMVNARHIFYGISMLDKYKGIGSVKPYLIFALTDETYSLVCLDSTEPDNQKHRKYYFAVSILNHFYWVIGTAVGAIAGTLINFSSEGIDFALTALFLTVFLEQWINSKNHTPAIIGVFISIFCLVLFGKNNFLIPAMFSIAASLIIYNIIKEMGEKNQN